MGSIARNITQSPPSIDIDGVPHRQCGEGRKQRRAGAVECGEIKPVASFVQNAGYSDGHGLICTDCANKQNARYTDLVKSAIVPIKVYDDVPIGGDGRCRGVAIDVNGVLTPYLVAKEACKYWGLDGQGQIQRIQDDPTLSTGLLVCKLHTSQGAVPAYVLRYDLVPLWLAGVETKRMRDSDRRAQLAAYQKVCGQVLSDYFFGTKTAPLPPAQRVQSDQVVISTPDTHVLEYFDSALSSALSKALTPFYDAISLVPGMDETTRKTLKAVLGARRVEIEIPAPVVNGDVYFGTLNTNLMLTALQEREAGDWENVPNLARLLMNGWICFIFGESTEVVKRMRKHSGKNQIGTTKPIRPSITSDKPKDLEKLFRVRKPAGVIEVPNTQDLLVVRENALAALFTLPSYMSLHEAKERLRIGWIWE